MTDKIEWCIARLGEDYKWWIEKLSNDIHSEAVEAGIIDPKQFEYIMELSASLQKYGLRTDVIENAFLKFRIASELPNSQIKLDFVNDKALDSEEPLFLLPNLLTDNEGPYCEFIDHIIALRVKLLNDVIDFKAPLNVDEIEDAMREIYQEKYISGNTVHVFDEIVEILEYTPAGYDIVAPQNDFDVANDDSEEDFSDVGDESFETEEVSDWDESQLQKIDVLDQ